MARSLALCERWEEAVSAAEGALKIAIGKLDRLDQAKSYLALGEAHRHGFYQKDAIAAYLEAVKLSVAVGHYDCLLWSSICLADSYFLTRQNARMQEALEPVKKILQDQDRRFPLETLHYQLSVEAIQCRDGNPNWRKLTTIVGNYERLGVKWPKDYLRLLKNKDFSTPKLL